MQQPVHAPTQPESLPKLELVELDDDQLASVSGGLLAGPNDSWLTSGPNDSW